MIRQSLFLFLFCLYSPFVEGKIPPNLADIKELLMVYHDSGEYYRQISVTIKEALAYLKFRINQNNRSKYQKHLAIVLDIDETALTNYPDMLHLNFGGTREAVDNLRSEGHDQAIPAVLTLYDYAEVHDVAVFFITERKMYERAATERNLKTVGYKHWRGLFMEPNSFAEHSITRFKMTVRKAIISRGYDIVLNIGDKMDDIKGDYADMVFKLPNPFYGNH